MRKPAAVLLGLLVLNGALLLFGAGRGQSDRSTASVRVGLVFDVGGLGDKSFNDAAYRGLVKAERELGVATRVVEPGDGSDRESALRQLASAGYDLVFGVGFVFTDDLRKLAGEFPQVAFAGIDYAAAPGQPLPPANLAGVRFREHEGSFVVGAIAGLETQSGIVGFVGGMKIPLIRKFEAGYEAGVKHVCPRCTVLGAYAGTEPKAFADPVTGRELAAAQYNRGADIIYHASGKTGVGVFQAARERGKRAIGTDSDQFDEAPCCVITSMLKRVDVAVYETIHEVVEGRFAGGVRELGLAENGVGFVYDDNNRALVKDSTIAAVNHLIRQIIAGEIEVPTQ
jgi:basic membrane protein A and related proteins